MAACEYTSSPKVWTHTSDFMLFFHFYDYLPFRSSFNASNLCSLSLLSRRGWLHKFMLKMLLLLYFTHSLMHPMCSCCQGYGHKHKNKPSHSFRTVHATEKRVFTTAIHRPTSGRAEVLVRTRTFKYT